MQALLLSILTASCFVFAVGLLLLVAKVDGLRSATRDQTATYININQEWMEFQKFVYSQPKVVTCNFPKTDEAALDDALIAPLPKTKGKRK